MGDYESGYDPKYGYNRNAFAHGTIVTAVMGRIVKLIVTPVGLGSEAIHQYKDKKKRSKSQPDVLPGASREAAEKVDDPNIAPSGDAKDVSTEQVFVEVSADQADQLVASHQAVPADGAEATHELIPAETTDDGAAQDEADWALDEAASEAEDKSADESQRPEAQIPSQMSSPAVSKPNRRSKNAQHSKLPFPVILPQRRPGTKARGFVRAYAPVLQDSGISQEPFLGFLKDFHKAAQASPIFDVVMVATAIAGAYPDIMIGLAVQAVQIAAGIGQEIQERYRTNRFLDQANKDIFVPRGIFALIVTYKKAESDETEVGAETIDMGASAFVKYGDGLTKSEHAASTEDGGSQEKGNVDEIRKKMKQLRVASGKTHEAQMPVTCAPLTFPALDAMADASAGESEGREGVASNIKAKAKGSSKFVNDYFDRRAQATYAFNNPNSTLTSQMAPAAPQFKSRFADPNNATNMHLFTLITGGRYKAEPLGARRRYKQAQRRAEEKRLQGIKEKSSNRLLQEGVLYLMIVNMPTETELELEKARNELREVKEKKMAAKKGHADS